LCSVLQRGVACLEMGVDIAHEASR